MHHPKSLALAFVAACTLGSAALAQASYPVSERP